MKGRREYVALISKSLGDRLTVRDGTAPNEVELHLKPGALGTLPEICSLLTRSLRARFLTLAASDERPLGGKLALYYVFSLPAEDLFFILRVPVDARHMEVPSVATVIESADWFEREVRDWFGIIAFPNIRRLATHPDWPEDVHPMLKTEDLRAPVPRVHGKFDFKHVEGEGVFEIPVGPVHAGIIEPGHFRFSVAGEPIINLDVQLFYTHKGTEKIAEGLPPGRVVFLAERVSGDSSFAHALAYCHALERMSGCAVPPRALLARTLLLELERLYNHSGDVGAILLDVGFAAGAARAFELKESFLRLNEMLTGSRLLRGVVLPGGVRRDPLESEAKRNALREAVTAGRSSLDSLMDLVASSSSVMDRLETTGRLSQVDAQRLGITGIAGRASGIDRDFRRDHPHCLYPSLKFRIASRKEGDVFARMGVRVDELRESFGIIDQLMETGGGSSRIVAPSTVPPVRSALGYCEGWRGEIVHWVMTDRKGMIYRLKITDPSFHNWRGLQVAVQGNIVPDFPVINKSFNLSYSGNDR
ncbi:MAG TPA: NADH-quinone oxidoreductase subunit C [Bacteroidota bacterium]|nr:NADH-quinone oxidoreductase subunit C [Bacteroidota bacterium]